MSIDFKWHVEEQDGSERAQPSAGETAGARRFRALRTLLALVLCLLALVGSVYAAIRWRADRGYQTARADLAAVVTTEAAALARGDNEVYRAFQDPADTDDPIESTRAWFTGLLYQSMATAERVQLADMELRDDRAWVQVTYDLDGVPYQRMQFYRQMGGQWRRTDPDPRFWGEAREMETAHFHFLYHEPEEEIVRRMALWAEAFYATVVHDFAPPASPGSITVELHTNEGEDEATFSLRGRRISMLSPLLTGVRLDDPTDTGDIAPAEYHLQPPAEVLQAMKIETPTASQLAYNVALMTAWEFYDAQPRRSFNWLMLQALVVQAVDTMLPEVSPRMAEIDLLQRAIAGDRLLPIESLRPTNRLSDERVEEIYVQSKSLVAYAQETYGNAAYARILLGLHLRNPEETIALAFQVDPAQLAAAWHEWVRAKYGAA